MKAIYLIGFMGSGKTTIGKALSEKWLLPVFDTDVEISKSEGKSITEIFEVEGETAFRSIEAQMLTTLPVEDAIITTGGGIIVREENRRWMKQNGIVIFLNATPAEILKRLENDETRPLLKNDKFLTITQLLEKRLPLYLESASYLIETSGKTVELVVEEISQRLKI